MCGGPFEGELRSELAVDGAGEVYTIWQFSYYPRIVGLDVGLTDRSLAAVI